MYEITYALLIVMIFFGIEGAIIDSFIEEQEEYTFYNIIKREWLNLYNKLNILGKIMFILFSFICLFVSVVLYKITFIISKYIVNFLKFLFYKK